MKSGTIGALAKAGGVGVETVRYYQRRGLMAEPSRAYGEVRRYGPEDVRRLRFIRSAQAAGFTLDEIAELLALDASHDRSRARQLAADRIAALTRLASACAEGEAGPCPIIAAFEPN
jgi:MerR family transcriptional regulator, mercuric resistance operon regulatory protein